jgi:hypothetical protein
MRPHPVSALLLGFLACAALGQSASNQKPGAPPPHMSKETRMDVVRSLQSELVYIRTPFPMGKKGLMLKDGVISPNGSELQAIMSMYGPAVKPGDQARISALDIKGDRIRFEINGGPIKKPKWYQRIEVGSGAGTQPVAPSDPQANPRGSFVDVVFDHYVPEMSLPQLKQVLRPVFDFDSRSALEAYLDTVPPKVKQAIQAHQVLVGMNREMVIYSKGRPPKKIREKDGETEYEDWIYGEPPQDVDFVRMVGDEVVRVETMKVDGQKLVRTAKEVDLAPKQTAAAAETASHNKPPTLRRPGEELPNDQPSTVTNGPAAPPPIDTPPPSGQPPNFAGASGGARPQADSIQPL